MECVIKGQKLHFEEYGQGKVILFLHGWGANGAAFDCVANRLTDSYRVIKLDFPGFGESDPPPVPWDVEQYAELTARFVESLGITHVNLVAHSFGGRVVIKMNRLEKNFTIDKVVLIDAAGVKPPKTLKKTLRTRAYKLGKGFLNLPPVRSLAPDALENFKHRMGSADYNALSGVMRDTLVRVVNEDLTDSLKYILCPVLLIWGDRDDATPLRDAKIMEREIPDSGLYVIEGAGHFSYLKNPPVVVEAIKNFF